MSESHGLRASSHRTEDWRQIDWRRVRRTVRRLQARIVKAIQDGRWNKVKALQRLLTHSFSGKALAVKRVTENHGKRTPGVDGVTWSTPHQKMTAIDSLRQRGYQAQPLRRVYIPKSTGKLRPLGITTMYDRAMQALYLLALEPIAETTGDECSYGFRPTRSAADAIERCFKLLSKRTSPQWILEGDIRSCFDWISHDWLLAKVTMDRSILRTWLKAGFMENDFLRPTNDGTPQGGVISPTLANLALDGLHNMLRDTFPQRHSYKVNLARYADDFIITGSSREVLENQVRPLVEQFLAVRGLELSADKTVVTHIEQGFDFLGQNVRKYKGKLLIKPSKASIRSVLREVRRIIRTSGSLTAGQLVERLNPVLWGWAYYHRHVVSSHTFASIDNRIWCNLFRWARRRHKRQSFRWIRHTYFLPHEGRHYVFTGSVTVGTSSGLRTVRIFRMASLPIRRHLLIRGAANPLDPAWNAYYQQRRRSRMIRSAVEPRPVTRADVEA